MTDLTEQYKHGNLPEDRLYYYRFKGEQDVQITTQYGLYCEEADNKKEIEVIDFVPSYEEYEQLENWNSFTADYHALREAKEIAEYEKVELLEKVKQLKERNDSLNNRDINLCRIANGIRDENFALKELLKECVKMNTRLENALWQWNEESNLYDENEALENKINEVLNA